MRTLLFVLLFLVVLAGCVAIPKPDWNPGGVQPAPQTGERATCPLPAQWTWNKEYSKWICVATPVYYGPMCPYPYGYSQSLIFYHWRR